MARKYTKFVSLGYDSDGKRIRKRVYGNTKKELEERVWALRKEYEERPAMINPRFKEYAEQWLETTKSQRSLNTYNSYLFTLRKMVDIDYLHLKDITRADVQMIINDNWEMRRTCENIKMTLNQIFNSAIADGVIIRNPVTNIEMPPKRIKAPEDANIDGRGRVLTEREEKAIKTVQLEPMDRLFLDILYTFGLRPGEALALRASDFNGEELTIDKSIAFNVNSPYLKGTKNGKSRKWPIPAIIRAEVREYSKFNRHMYLFHTQGEELMTKISYRHMWGRIAKALNVELGGTDQINVLHGMTAYTIRHDVSSRLRYLDGISQKMKAYLMGHSEQVLLNEYSHLILAKEDRDKLKEHMII